VIVTILVFNQPRPTQPGHPPWVNAVSTDDGFDREEIGEFCVTVGHIISTYWSSQVMMLAVNVNVNDKGRILAQLYKEVAICGILLCLLTGT